MKIIIEKTPEEMGKKAAKQVICKLKKAIDKNGKARILLSTGASQFQMFEALVQIPFDWTKVEMFHLDEYVGLPITHIASFRKYLTERFVNKVGPLGGVYFVNGEQDPAKTCAELKAKIDEAPIDVGLIGIGENGHIAFNDPPADFDTEEAYIVVNLNDRCKGQQVGEGWFPTKDDVPPQAISMSVKQIMKCRSIITVAPHAVKAEALRNTLAQDVNNIVPATIMKTHPDFTLYTDAAGASGFCKY